MKALEDFMYKGKHVKGGDEVAIDAKDVPKLRGLGKIPVPQDGPEPVKKKAKPHKYKGIDRKPFKPERSFGREGQ